MSAAESTVPAVVSGAAAEALGLVRAPGAHLDGQQLEKQIEQAVEQATQAATRAAAQAAGEAAQSEAQARIAEEVARAQKAVADMAVGGQGGQVSIIKGPDGNVTVTFPGGGSFVVSEGLITPGAVEGILGSMAHQPPPPPPPPLDPGPPDSIIRLFGLIFGLIALMVIGFPIARAIGRRVEGRGTAPTGGGVPADVAARLERIEQAMDAVAVEVERVSEAQRYTARLLTERLPEQLPQLAGAADAVASRGPGGRG